MNVISKIVLASIAAASLWSATPATAQTFPSRPITIVSPFPPGGIADPLARLIAARMSETMGQRVIVDNRTGAGGIIGTESVSRAAPDGYTVLMGTTALFTVNPTLYKKLAYDAVKDFQPLTLVASTQMILVVPPMSPATSVADLVGLAKTKSGGLQYAGQGTGAAGHLLGEMLKMRTGTQMSHVPYKGSGPAVQDVIAGRVDFFFDGLMVSGPFVKQGRMKGLAIASRTRSKLFPDVPTMAEAGFPGIEMDNWFAMFVPSKTSPAVAQKLQEEIVKAVRHPEVANKLTEMGLDIVTSTPQELAALITAETAQYGKVVRESGASVD